jgi:hypothetical protein
MSYEYKHNKIALNLIKERMKLEGRTTLFHSLRLHVIAPPMNVPEKGGKATRLCALLLPPLDGSDPEVPMTGEMGLFIEKYRKYPMENLPPPPLLDPKVPGLIDFRVKTVPDSPLHQEMVKDMEKSKRAWKDEWERLRKGMAPDQLADAAECLVWALRNESQALNEIKPEEVPDPMALTVLKYMKSGGLGEIMRIGFPKLMPDKKQMENANRFADDNREIYDMFDAFEKEIETEEEVEAA